MDALEADFRLALAHVEEVKAVIADQRARIDLLRERGGTTDNEERVLEALLKSHDLLVKHLEHLKRLHIVRDPKSA